MTTTHTLKIEQIHDRLWFAIVTVPDGPNLVGEGETRRQALNCAASMLAAALRHSERTAA